MYAGAADRSTNTSPKIRAHIACGTFCSERTVNALRALDWEKPNAVVGTALPLTNTEQSVLATAIAWSANIVRVGPLARIFHEIA